MTTDASQVYLRKIKQADEREFVTLMKASITLHEPWITAPSSNTQFRYYLQRIAQPDHEGYGICLKASDELAGVININNIVRGSFQSASLGYYVGAPFQGQGVMFDGLTQLLKLACGTMGLHRLEANIQPQNERSQKLVERCGFVNEGMSKDFLFINGRWRDHVRWCYIDARKTLRSANMEPTLMRWKST